MGGEGGEERVERRGQPSWVERVERRGWSGEGGEERAVFMGGEETTATPS